MTPPVRILFLADSHLGLDLPEKPRVLRRRRGHDFLANHSAALSRALTGEFDVVIHGGDVFDRPSVSPVLAHMAYAPLLRVAEKGVPVFVVPGNHERSRLPHARLLQHPLVHVFDAPRTVVVDVRGHRLALSGFPFERGSVRARFPELLARTGWRDHEADTRLLCIHHCVEGAVVGPGDFTFTKGADVIRGRDVPAGFAAVLSGHIHRHQVLTTHLSGRPLAAPVLYPGSLERTSTAEIGEPKGWLRLELDAGGLRWQFEPLAVRPMHVHRLDAGSEDGTELDARLRELVAGAEDDAVLVVHVDGTLTRAQLRVVSTAHVRSLTPASMNVEVRAADHRVWQGRRPRTTVPAMTDHNLALDL